MGQLIYITGCARSGTQLLFKLFDCFKDIYRVSSVGEVTLLKFLAFKDKDKNIVGKRVPLTIFSNSESLINISKQIALIKEYDIKIVNIFRDGRDIIMSKHPRYKNYFVEPKRWMDSIEQMNRLKELINVNVRYEDLVNNPDEVQNEIANSLNLTITKKFSDYYISNERVGSGKDSYINRISNDKFEDYLRTLNYKGEQNGNSKCCKK